LLPKTPKPQFYSSKIKYAEDCLNHMQKGHVGILSILS